MDDAGRCRRTDGKKWRCSKAVIPNQKYCEKHMHRGCRSRRLVESSVYTSKIPLNLKFDAHNPSTDVSNSPNGKIAKDNSKEGSNGAVTKIVFKSAASSAIKPGENKQNVGQDNECGNEKNKGRKLDPNEKNGNRAKDGGSRAPQTDDPDSGIRAAEREDSELRRCRKADGKRGQCGEDEKHCKKLMHRASKEAACGLPGS